MRFRHAAGALALLLATASGTMPARAEQTTESERVAPNQTRDQRTFRGSRHMGGDGGWLRSLGSLHVTQAQRTRIVAIIRNGRSDLRPLEADMRETQRALRAESERGSFDEGRVRVLARRQAQTQSELLIARARMTSRIFAVLTPSQRDELRDLRNRQDDRRGGRYDRRGGYRGNGYDARGDSWGVDDPWANTDPRARDRSSQTTDDDDPWSQH